MFPRSFDSYSSKHWSSNMTTIAQLRAGLAKNENLAPHVAHLTDDQVLALSLTDKRIYVSSQSSNTTYMLICDDAPVQLGMNMTMSRNADGFSEDWVVNAPANSYMVGASHQ